MSLTLQQLRYFLAAAETGNASRAAERCNVSQPSITVALKNLEEFLGVQLFSRRAAGLRLTAEGERFALHTASVLAGVNEAVADARRPSAAVCGRVAIGVTETITGYLVPALLGAVRQSLPGIEVSVAERERSDIIGGLLRGEYDFAIVLVSNIAPSTEVQRRTLLRSPRRLWVAVDHPLAARETVALADVADADYLLLDMDEHVETVRRYWSAYGIAPKVVMQSRSLEGVRSLVAAGLGVTILSDLVYRGWSHGGQRIRRIALADNVPTMDVGLAFRRGATLTASASALVQFLCSWAQTLTGL